MTHNQSSTVFNTPLKKRIAIGAASVLTAGALLGVGVAGASASPITPSAPPVSASASANADGHADGHRGHAFGATVANQIREAFFQSTADGLKAQKLAVIAVGKTELFAKLPAQLRTDLGTLAKAPAADATRDAEKISTTALSGGYGKAFASAATSLKTGAKHPFGASLRDELRGDVGTGHDLGRSAKKLATNLIGNPDVFAKLPANLQSDLTAIKNAPASEAGAEAKRAEATALSGGYGAQVQKIAEHLPGVTAGK